LSIDDDTVGTSSYWSAEASKDLFHDFEEHLMSKAHANARVKIEIGQNTLIRSESAADLATRNELNDLIETWSEGDSPIWCRDFMYPATFFSCSEERAF